MNKTYFPTKQGLYDPGYEHDNCGVGFLVQIDGKKSHEIVLRSVEVLRKLLHRGATGEDAATGDGAGILIQIPDEFFRNEVPSLGFKLPEEKKYGVGMIFFPPQTETKKNCQVIIEDSIAEENLSVLGWRNVPVNSEALGEKAREAQPDIAQVFIGGQGLEDADLERKLYVIRQKIEYRIEELMQLGDRFYIPSFSCRTIVYKGMMLGDQVQEFYLDLNDKKFVSALAVIHQRYSTNTFPSWKLSQPFRYLAHNGEINTLRGNLNQMHAREKFLDSPLFKEDIKKILPIIDETGSDSACLDNALELLANGGRDLSHAMMMLIPQAWGLKYPIGPDLKGFFEYHAGMMEPWDGPAAVAFTNGKHIGALLDRNGLRPARYLVTRDGFMVMASEAGVLDFEPEDILERGALRPGEIILVDTARQRLIKDGEVKTYYAHKQPYRRWVEENRVDLHGLFSDVAEVIPDTERLLFRQKLFGYTREDLDTLISPMASKGYEPVGSMGTDTPLAVFSERPQMLYNYFKQLFAQITNPAIDPIREELVMSLMTFIGNPANILSEVPQNSHLIKLRHPILSNDDLDRIIGINDKKFSSVVLKIGFPANSFGDHLEEAIEDLCRQAEESVVSGCSLLILSDKDLPEGVAPIPALLAVSAVNRHLIRLGIRTSAGIIVQTGDAREVHHMALLLGFGATAVNPYLAFETIADMAKRGALESDISVVKALENYIKAINKGLLKIMSKMGISTLRSYRSAQVFEAVGLNTELVEKYFTGAASRVEGIGLEEIAREANAKYLFAYKEDKPGVDLLASGGQYCYRKDGERHLWNPETISKLQYAARTDNEKTYKEYAQLINNQAKNLSTFRGMFNLKENPISIDEVEPVEEIMKRFVTGAMSFGSISREAHETLAVAMNRIGGMSNSGEGGEDPARYIPLPNGDSRCSAVKQVASGRFGVTAEYLVSAREMQIKISQGAKPGEGGQLPGHKVNEEIAKVRHSTPGVTLISPPPHHDIYSIEDIKQLIFDLRNCNPKARVSVKLVSEVGVGTIAAGVAKAHADMVLISGYDGGTGASPLSSIKHAGMPWELGLAETQQTLVLNNLRGRIRVQTDGNMKTGRDVVVAALLGAEEYGFSTAALVVCGCIMMRKCHLNTCPVGVATQDPEMRKRYTGKPDYVVNFFRFVAQEVREYLALLGVRKLDDLIGRSDLLEVNQAIDFWKSKGLDFSRILYQPDVAQDIPRRSVGRGHPEIEDVLDKELISKAKKALEEKSPVVIKSPIRNVHLTTGAMLSGEIARRYGSKGLEDDTITCRFRGSAGQSFGAFCMKGLTLILEGEANDYVGKGMCGGKIIVKPEPAVEYIHEDNIAAGNVILYGATSGEIYINGRVGERFAIRNSGVKAVVEGVGDHACEYMTGGRVVILGDTGVNFGAGMSGGLAYVYDPNNKLDSRCNLTMVDLELVVDPSDVAELKRLIENHYQYTGSQVAKNILKNWDAALPSFVKVFPMEYRRVLGKMMKEDEETAREEVVFK